MPELTLLREGNPLSQPREQQRILASTDWLPTFDEALEQHSIAPLAAAGIEVLQLNVGKLCNQTCHHCHVDAGPDRRESMSRETADDCLRALAAHDIPTLDVTGGAPEMNPNFGWLVTEGRRLERRVIDRCNLTILVAPGFEYLPEFLADQQVEIVASLPCYVQENCDRQRGDGVFARSIEALRRLNDLGYGQPGSPLVLTLVYNPIGPSLPPSQAELEADYRRELSSRYGIEFTKLYTITNLPISRFLDDLLRSDQYDRYLETLVHAFNPLAAEGVMCRSMISVDWQGRLYDCDFNQMLELPLAAGMPRHIREFDLSRLSKRQITTGRHCFGCTAGAGSGCQGAIEG
jgi:radical SAM/Cys-rich protein